MHFLAALLFALVSTSAAADQFYLTASLECNPAKPELTASFHGSWNEAGEIAVSNLSANQVDPRKLVSFTKDADGRYSIIRTTESKTCRLGQEEYVVEFSPLMAPQFDPEGFCATRIGARVTVSLRGNVVAVAGIDACTETGKVTTTVSLRPKHKPIYVKVKAAQFYGT
jgi:hypothetical protein